jgi:hypothetical protein
MRQQLMIAAVFVVGSLALAPSAARAQSTATAQMVTCKDGTTSKGGQGACSQHGGIATGAMAISSTPGGGKIPNQKPAPTPPQPTKTGASADSTGAIAQCTDGMFWDGTARQGACSGHKGVKRWLPGAPAK